MLYQSFNQVSLIINMSNYVKHKWFCLYFNNSFSVSKKATLYSRKIDENWVETASFIFFLFPFKNKKLTFIYLAYCVPGTF